MLFFLLACSDHFGKTTESVGPMTDVRVDIENGNVVLSGGLSGVGTLKWDWQGPVSPSHRLSDGVLSITASCPPLLHCSSNMSLDLASNLPVSIKLGEGSVDVSHMTRSLQVQVEKANVRLTDLRSPKVRVNAGWGEVYVQLKEVPERVDIDVVVGNIVLELPYAEYNLGQDSEKSKSGAQKGGIPIRMHTSSGEARLKVVN
ncbi:MAG TPA: hypothetical protein PKW90_29160 [Myxococcota bacterium]|nr:hypothetical protein [Myxococcota bacterium]